MCRDLSDISTYAHVDNTVFRLIKNNTPGNYTFILRATKEVPRRLMSEKRKTIGLRIPANPIAMDLLAAMGEPLMSASLILRVMILRNLIRKKLTMPGQAGGSGDPRRLYRPAADHGYRFD